MGLRGAGCHWGEVEGGGGGVVAAAALALDI